jgi:hypothetical protein
VSNQGLLLCDRENSCWRDDSKSAECQAMTSSGYGSRCR